MAAAAFLFDLKVDVDWSFWMLCLTEMPLQNSHCANDFGSCLINLAGVS